MEQATTTVIDDLLMQETLLRSKLKAVTWAIKSLCDLCTHNWVREGHGHNYSVERCTICKETREV